LLASQLAILFTLSAVLRSASLAESVQIAAVVMALVPQGLLAMITVSYAMAAVRMVGKGILIQQANAIESMSHVDVLCLDKTGTLTTNSLRLDTVLPLGVRADHLANPLRAFVGSVPDGNRTTEAIRAVYGAETLPTLQTVSFSSERKWSGVAFDDESLHGVYVLGAPETLQQSLHLDGDVGSRVVDATRQGLRVLLFAYKRDIEDLRDSQGSPQLPSDLIPLGLLNFRDELRPEAQETLARFAEAGVEVKLLSGDNPETVAAFVRQAGFGRDARMISGPELSRLDYRAFSQVVQEMSIFGRLTPQQKQQIVRSLRESGKYVAMIGDGVNDVLALKESRLGLAMQSGSQVTRGMADIVLLENSFTAVPVALREGQRIIQGMLDVMRLLLTRTLYLGLLIVGSAIVGLNFPITPRQDGIISVLTVGIPILGLTAWARPSAPPRSTFRSIVHFVVPAAFSVATLLLAIHVLYLQTTGDAVLARTALTTTAVLCGLLLIAFVEPVASALADGDTVSGDWRPSLLALGMAGLYCGLLFLPAMRTFFGLTELRIQDFAVIIAGISLWAGGLIGLWRTRFFERWLRIDTT
jgi:cation-transporting ATPase E